MTDDDLHHFAIAGANLLGIPLDPAWQDGVVANLRVILDHGGALLDPPLPDRIDPAPVFRA